jgi:hypothetical protein
MPTIEKSLIETTKELYSKATRASEDTMDIIKKGEEYLMR